MFCFNLTAPTRAWFLRTVLVGTVIFATHLPASPLPVSPGCGATTYLQDDTDGNGIVAMEAEVSTSNDISRVAGHIDWVNWLEYTSNDAANGGYVRVNTVGYNDANVPAAGARLDFDIDFVKTGVHYIHLRYRAASVADNSVHLYMDDVVFAATYQVPVSTTWAWDECPNTFTINTVGTHTLTLFHREDGMDLDRIVITTDPDYVLTGFGPDPTENGTHNSRGFSERVETHMDYRSGEGIAVVEAENYTYNMSGLLTYECEPWYEVADPTASGDAYMVVSDLGSLVDPTLLWEAPLLDYEISSAVTDNYYLYVRHRSTSGASNSIHVATNYQYEGEWRLNTVTDWTWERFNLGTVTAYGGQIILSIVMREDGTPIDKLIVSSNPWLAPGAEGPLETVMLPARLIYEQETGPEHLVQLPMETPSRRLPGLGLFSDLRWEYGTDASAIGGRYAEVEDPGLVNNLLNGLLSVNAPVQEFDINFNQTGTHYLYVRHRAPDGNNNSYTYLFDGAKINEVSINTFSPASWRFYDALPTITVPSTGVHTLGIAMREDGTPIDHISLSTTPAYNAMTLPAELLTLEGEEDGNRNRIAWSTATESSTAYFHLERSERGYDGWSPIGSLPAAGNSNDVTEYQFFDNYPPDLAYYRLVTVDLDGTESRSSVITVSRSPSQDQDLQVFPNPARDVAHISLSLPRQLPLTLRLSTLGGQAVAVREIRASAGKNEVDLPVDRLPAGRYTLTAEIPGDRPLISQLYVVR